MNPTKHFYLKILIGTTLVASVFHFLIFLKVIPYDITWGGRLKNDQEMYVFETISIFINSFFVYILFQKGEYVRKVFSEKVLAAILWFFFTVFILNTVGNIVAETTLEKTFAVITLVSAILIWNINKK